MKSVVLCEGQDDLWFIGYYLHKKAGWKTMNAPGELWKYYLIPEQYGQHVIYLRNGNDSVAVWDVGGKNCFQIPIRILLDKIIREFPFDPIDSIVIMSDRDNDPVEDTLNNIKTWAHLSNPMENKKPSIYKEIIDDCEVLIKVVPIIIPFEEDGAIETVLLSSISECSGAGKDVVERAKQYVDELIKLPSVKAAYLQHERLHLKAKFDAAIAITNPGHSTGLFKDLVMLCPWEASPHVQEHFDVMCRSISS